MKIPFFSRKKQVEEPPQERREPALMSGSWGKGGARMVAGISRAAENVSGFHTEKYKDSAIAFDSDGGECSPAIALRDKWNMGSLSPDDALLGWYSGQFFMGYPMLAVISQNWLVQKACAMPARDAVRHGYERTIAGLDEKDVDRKKTISAALDIIDKDFKVLANCEEFVRMGRVFGLRIMFFEFAFKTNKERKEWYKNPFNMDGITKDMYAGIRQVDPTWCKPIPSSSNLVDPSLPNFYEPDFWRIGQMMFHRSHLLFFRTEQVPDILKPMYNFGGVSVPQKIFERVYNAERTANEAPLLALTKRLVVWKTDTETVLNNQAMTEEHLSNLVHLRNNFGVHVTDTEDETTQLETNLTGFDDIVMNQFQLVAAASNVPATKLLGTTPKGFQSTGESETKSYHEELETIQTNDLSQVLDWHYEIALRSLIEDDVRNGVTIGHNWNGVDSPTEKEAADTLKVQSERDSALIMDGVVTAEEVRERIARERGSGYYGIPTGGGSPEDLQDDLERTVNELNEGNEELEKETPTY